MSRDQPVSVVISTFQEGDALAATVASLDEAEDAPHEIIVVDDGSTDGSCDRAWPARVRVLRQAHHGIAAARNRGARVATQPVVVFLDAHCAVEGPWLRPLLRVLGEAPRALVGPAVRDADDRRYVGCGAEIVDELFTYRWRRAAADEGVVEVGLVPGGCLAVRRDTFMAAGGFADFEGFGVEDVELALRWWRAGHPLLGVPESLVTHRFRATAPYRPDHRAWLQNVLRTALLHLSGDQLRACVSACTRFELFGPAIATALAKPWMELHRQLAETEHRPVEEYLRRWAPKAFPG
ncbi:glycosyltransferase [Frankia sp. CNm7]|uniref:Glycosyltransferase n=1 Tax=Frankia nepalensis TaxID=1836974 RepID=A0A937RDA2_9ACTN|nr:glycosyltransferase [Frankia nepalensis]MBL7497170.1 glycosyltransferase [Frankia nepalensis]MBL7513112.1 glycosyltransferase [Frankia nepalensis]MBL7518327.1 glycosyltransferase [Frankia nepalensis]MBL7626875.1 glycosyltransferase [Frankia nepalensis]